MQQNKLRAWEAFLRAHAALLPQLESDLVRASGMPLNYYDVLVQLSGARGGRMRLNELNQCVVLSQSALSRLVDRMAAEGLVCREASPADKRGTVVCMTSAGSTAFRRAAPVHLASIARRFGDVVSDEEAEVIAAVFDRVRAAATR